MRSAKKSDTIEVRLPHTVKRAFMERCRVEGRTASDVVRSLVEARIAEEAPGQEQPAIRRFFRPAAAAAMIGALAIAMPSAVSASPDLRPGFAALDRNRDGMLTPDEFGAGSVPPVHCCSEHRVMALPLRRAAMPGVWGMRPFAISVADFGSFTGADANRDGKVSFGEYAAHRLRLFHAGFDLLDTDHDRRLDPEEYVAAWRIFTFRGDQPDLAPFRELDRNGDGKVSWEEFLA